MEPVRILAYFSLIAPLAIAACGRSDTAADGTGSAEGTADSTPVSQEQSIAARATTLAQEAIIVDTHIDVPYRMLEEYQDISGLTERNFDYPKAIEGGLDAAFMSIYVPAEFGKAGGAYEHAEKLIDMVEGFVERWPEKFAIATSPADVRQQDAVDGLISLALGMENGAPVGDLEDLQHFYERGIRYITLTHSEDNQISDSSYSDAATWGGLSDFGREVVAEMNRLGIMVDVSHLSDEAFWDVMEVSSAPAIASHSSCRYFTPGFQRNMSDEMIQALAEHGGVIQINFGSGFLTQEANAFGDTMDQARDKYFAGQEVERGSAEAEAWRDAYLEKHPFPYADVAALADHIVHVIQLVGVDHVGLGSDFDGVGDSLPAGLKDVSDYPNLVAELLRRGLTEEEIRQILGSNLLRVWGEVERIAAETGTSDVDAG